MLPQSDLKLEQLLIRLLSEKRKVTVTEVLAYCRSNRQRYSQSAVYKQLSKLQRTGTVIKHGHQYTLSLSWINEILAMGEKLEALYFSETYLKTLLPPAGSSLKWRSNSLMRCNDLWNQLLLALLKQSNANELFAWVPHPWFLLVHSQKEARLHRSLDRSGKRFYTIFGADRYLDRLAEKFYERRSHKFSFAESDFATEQQRYIDLIGDYVLTVTLDKETAKRIENLFISVDSAKDLESSGMVHSLSLRCNATITLECKPKKANALRLRFVEYFDYP